jgi:hypothetical protein
MLIINWNAKIARRRATLDIVLNEETHQETIKERTLFSKIRSDGDLAKLANISEIGSDKLQAIRSVLNRYELVSIGIRRKTLDGEIYRDWCRTTLVGDWIAVKPLIETLREKNDFPLMYCEFEALAKKWATTDEKNSV